MMMENDMKVSELEGEQLDRCVGQALGWQYDERAGFPCWMKDGDLTFAGVFDPTTNWAIGGPIIEREGIDIAHGSGWCLAKIECLDEPYIEVTGPTPLVAAMRCFVAAKLGEKA